MRLTDRDKVSVRSNALEYASAFFECGEIPDTAELLRLWVMIERGLTLGPAAIVAEYVTPPAPAAVVRLGVVT